MNTKETGQNPVDKFLHSMLGLRLKSCYLKCLNAKLPFWPTGHSTIDKHLAGPPGEPAIITCPSVFPDTKIEEAQIWKLL